MTDLPTLDFSGRRDVSDAVNERIDAALTEAQAHVPPRRYLGASLVGEPCRRKAAFLWHDRDGERFGARILRIFETGHRTEDMAIGWLIGAGFDLQTRGANGEQIGFELLGGRFAGHCDGILRGWLKTGPAPIALPALWECKSMKAARWNALKKRGLRAVEGRYYAQVQLYLAYVPGELWRQGCLFTAVNKDTSEIYHEFVMYDPAAAQRATETAVQILTSAEPKRLPRIAQAPTDYRCRMCRFAAVCWSDDS